MPSKGEKPAPIVLTMGEPAGIGPEITALAWLALKDREDICFFVVGDRNYLDHRVAQLRRDVRVVPISEPAEAKARYHSSIPILDAAFARSPTTGAPSPDTARQVIHFIDRAVSLAMNGDVSAMVTNPIQKETLYDAGFRHEGHTDYLAFLARKAGAEAEPVMMLCAPGLRTIPLTVHIPLSEVPRRLTPDVIVRQAKIACGDLKSRFAIASPRLGVTGLNPHAGENGAMGKEEQSIIAPAIASLKSQGFDIEGPFPADTAFHAEARIRFDAILCMYHDQALIPVKTLDFHGGVNCTLGLPFVRTSPDHGTGLALAGTGKARPDSLIAAIELAAKLAHNSAGR